MDYPTIIHHFTYCFIIELRLNDSGAVGCPRMERNTTVLATGAAGLVGVNRSDLAFVVGFLVTFYPNKK
jgi:hypothetical protein